MTSTGEPVTPADLVTRIRAVGGVTDIYSPRAAIAQIPTIVAAATGTADDGATADIVITVKNGTPTVAARIATSGHDHTPETARRVADTLLAHTPREAQIILQVARIH